MIRGLQPTLIVVDDIIIDDKHKCIFLGGKCPKCGANDPNWGKGSWRD